MKHRRGVSTYLQTFVLVAVALGGSLVAYREASAYASSEGGPAVSVWGATLRQGAAEAVERIVVSEAGAQGFDSLYVLNPGLTAAVRYCYVVTSTSGAALGGTCPAMTGDPTSILIRGNATSTGTVVIVVMLEGAQVAVPGRAYPVVVGTPGAAPVTMQVVASPI